MPDDRTRQGGTADLLRRDESPNGEQQGLQGATPPVAQAQTSPNEQMPLLSQNETASFRDKWEQCQRSFVDEPRKSVEMGDQLVPDLVRELAQQFADERSRLEAQWDRGEDVSTDELRLALQRYRSFFNRLLSV